MILACRLLADAALPQQTATEPSLTAPGRETANALARISHRNVPWSTAVAAHHLAFPRDGRAAAAAEQCQPARDGGDARVRERGEPVVEGAEDRRRPSRAIRGDTQRGCLSALSCRARRHHRHARRAHRARQSGAGPGDRPRRLQERAQPSGRHREHDRPVPALPERRLHGNGDNDLDARRRADRRAGGDRTRAARGNRDRQGAARRTPVPRLPRAGDRPSTDPLGGSVLGNARGSVAADHHAPRVRQRRGRRRARPDRGAANARPRTRRRKPRGPASLERGAARIRARREQRRLLGLDARTTGVLFLAALRTADGPRARHDARNRGVVPVADSLARPPLDAPSVCASTCAAASRSISSSARASRPAHSDGFGRADARCSDPRENRSGWRVR